MKNKIVVVVLMISFLFLTNCQSKKDFYDSNNVSIKGIFKDKETNYLVFSVPQESFFYCGGVIKIDTPLTDKISISFVRTKVNGQVSESIIDYKTDFIKNNSMLKDKFNLDPTFYYIKLKTPIKELDIYDGKKTKNILIGNVTR